MSNLKYKDYMGSVEYSEEDGCLHFNIRIPAELHAKIAYLAQSAGISLNAFIKETLTKAVM